LLLKYLALAHDIFDALLDRILLLFDFVLFLDG